MNLFRQMRIKDIGGLIVGVVIFVLPGLSGCKENEVNPMEELGFVFTGRMVNYVWSDNLKKEFISHTVNNQTLSYDCLRKIEGNESVGVQDYILSFNTYNVGFEEIGTKHKNYFAYFNSESYDPINDAPFKRCFDIPGDSQDVKIENEIKSVLSRQYGDITSTRSSEDLNESPRTRAIIEKVDYRVTPMEGIKITCSESIFGVKSGESLNDMFVVHSFPSFHQFIINKDRVAVRGPLTNISISKYLSYSPLAPAQVFMAFKNGVELEEGVTACFTIELTLDNGRKISGRTRAITLVP